MTPPTAVAPVLISDLNNTSMRIPIQIGAKGEPVSTHALIDSGAEGQFIDVNFVLGGDRDVTRRGLLCQRQSGLLG